MYHYISDYVRNVAEPRELYDDILNSFCVMDETAEIFSNGPLEGKQHYKTLPNYNRAISHIEKFNNLFYDYKLNAPTYDEVMAAFSDYKKEEHEYLFAEIKHYLEPLTNQNNNRGDGIVVDKGIFRHRHEKDDWTFSIGRGFQAYILTDYSNSKSLKTRTETLHKRMLFEETLRKQYPNDKKINKHNPRYQEVSKEIKLEEACKEYPIELYLTGMDDCSYKKFYRTKEEAQIEIFCYNNKQNGFRLYKIISENNDFVFNN